MRNLLTQIKSICDFQLYANCHKLTCGNNSRHSILYPAIKDDKIILKCLDCGYEQTYIPEFLVPKDTLERNIVLNLQDITPVLKRDYNSGNIALGRISEILGKGILECMELIEGEITNES